jgi:hypothetical protein
MCSPKLLDFEDSCSPQPSPARGRGGVQCEDDAFVAAQVDVLCAGFIVSVEMGRQQQGAFGHGRTLIFFAQVQKHQPLGLSFFAA